uniref:Putative ovule protein n=1 Tax=Solanum chacoense TaxID=4108 RepID=A0A0V0HFZ0_SOLCH
MNSQGLQAENQSKQQRGSSRDQTVSGSKQTKQQQRKEFKLKYHQKKDCRTWILMLNLQNVVQ